MKRTALIPKIIFAGGTLLGYFYLPLSSYVGGSYDSRAAVGGVIASIASIILFIKIIQSKQIPLKHVIIGIAMGLLVVSFWAQQQVQRGYVTYVARGGNDISQVDWRQHPAVAFYTITWGVLTIPALFFYATARSKET